MIIRTASDLAHALLDWETNRRELNALEVDITAYMLETGKSAQVGDVRATYYAGRKTYQWEQAARDHKFPYELLVQYEKPTYDWKGICEHLGITQENCPFTDTGPRVTLKLDEPK